RPRPGLVHGPGRAGSAARGGAAGGPARAARPARAGTPLRPAARPGGGGGGPPWAPGRDRQRGAGPALGRGGRGRPGWGGAGGGVDVGRGYAVVRASERIDHRTVPALRTALDKSLHEWGKALLDTCAVQHAEPICAALLPAVLTGCGGWPVAKLAVFGAGHD